MGEDLPVIPGYRDLEPIASGGFGQVYRGVHDITGRVVAIKLLARFDRNDTKSHDRFTREARAMTELSKVANVVDIHDAGFTEADSPYLAMSFFGGGSLGDQLGANGPLAPGNVVEIGMTIGRALDRAHRQGIAHRDLKPDNILLDDDGEIALSDFGLAVTATTDLTGDSRFMMTPEHTPPERLTGPAGQTADPRLADIYSFGSTLYMLLSGRPPFGTERDLGTAEFARRVVHEPLPPIGRSDVSPALEAVITKAMAKSPEERFSSANELVSALEALPREPSVPLRPIDRTPTVPEPEHEDLDEVAFGADAATSDQKEPTRFRSGEDSSPSPDDARTGVPAPPPMAPLLAPAGAQAPAAADQTVIRPVDRAATPSAPADSGDRRSRVGAYVGGAAAAVLLVGIVALTLTRSGSDTEASPTPSATEPPAATVLADVAVPTVDLVRGMADGGVSFTWSYAPNTEDQASVGYRLYIDGGQAGPSRSIAADATGQPLTEQVLSLADIEAADSQYDPATSELCIEVFLLLETGISDRSPRGCLSSSPTDPPPALP